MLLREIKYMKYLDKQGIPPDGLELYGRNEKLQVHIVQATLVISQWGCVNLTRHYLRVYSTIWIA